MVFGLWSSVGGRWVLIVFGGKDIFVAADYLGRRTDTRRRRLDDMRMTDIHIRPLYFLISYVSYVLILY